MATYTVIVPHTFDQGSSKFTAYSSSIESVAANALWSYNKMRERDGQDELKRMPNGTRYVRIMN